VAEQPEQTVTEEVPLLDYQLELGRLVMEVPPLLGMQGLQRWIRAKQL